MPKITVARFEKYPPEEPTGWAVGFLVELENGRSFYIDTTVGFDEANTDEEVLNAAWEKLRESVNSQVQALSSKPPILGRQFTPPS